MINLDSMVEGLELALTDPSLDPNDHRALLFAKYLIKDVARKQQGITERHDVKEQ